MALNVDQQLALLSRRCERILGEDDLRRKLSHNAQGGKPLRIKFGMDPTAPDLTLGHAVPLKVIRQFQEWGHKAVLIIGDYTARVGDPTGRNKTRPHLSGEEIDRNAKTYVAQVGKILLTDAEHLEVRFNGEWLGKMGLVDVIRLAARKSVAQILTREDFAKRYAEGVDIRLHEILYPLLQGWDSVVIEADVEMGGSDQLFNNLVGREFQKEEGKDAQAVIVTPLLVGTDGADKMSKSKGNYIGVTDPPGGDGGMFGKIMSLPDHLMESYYTLLTDLPKEDFLPAIAANPRDAKVRLAKHIIAWLHDAAAADAAEKGFFVATHGGIPDEMPEVALDGNGPHKLAPLMVKAGMAASNGEAMRKMKEGAVKIDGQKVTDYQKDYTFDHPVVLQMGSRKFARLRPCPVIHPELNRFLQHIGLDLPALDIHTLPVDRIETSLLEEHFKVNVQHIVHGSMNQGKVVLPRTYFFFVDRPEFNAFADEYDGACFLGVFQGTVMLIWDLFFRLLSHPAVLKNVGNAAAEQIGPFHGQGVSANYRTLLKGRPKAFTLADVRPRDPQRYAYAQRLAKLCCDFVTVHEIGHLRHGHCRYQRVNGGISFISELAFGTSASGQVDPMSWQAIEMDADCYAVSVTLPMHLDAWANLSAPKDIGFTEQALFDWCFAINCLFSMWGWEHSADSLEQYRYPPPPYRATMALATAHETCRRMGDDFVQRLLRAIPSATTAAFAAIDTISDGQHRSKFSKFYHDHAERNVPHVGLIIDRWTKIRPEVLNYSYVKDLAP